MYKGKCLGPRSPTFNLVVPLQQSSLQKKQMLMRGLATISSLAFILALSSKVAVAAPRAADSPVPKAAENVLEGTLNDRSATTTTTSGCTMRGPCGSSIQPEETCCGPCLLIDSGVVSQDACLQQVLTPQHKVILINFSFT